MTHVKSAGPCYTRLHNQIFIAMILGAILGSQFGEDAAFWLGWLGTLFVRLLKMVIVPLILTSIVTGVASIGSGRDLGRLGLKTLTYYIATSMLAIFVGLALVNTIRPGVGADLANAARENVPDLQPPSSLGDIFIRMVPTNPIEALASADMLAIIFFAIVLGVGITRLPEAPRRTLSDFFNAGFELMMVVTGGVIRLAPLGVLGLITSAVAAAGLDTFKPLAWYAVTIVSGLAIHMFVTLPLLLMLIGGIKPLTHYRNMRDALVMAFSTSSSSATLPVTMQCLEERVGVSNRVTSFVIPMGATINMDGTALYECAGVIFISQVLGIGLDFTGQVTVAITALLASIGAAGIPSAGLVMIFIVTDAVNLKGPEVALIIGAMLAVDRPLDMLRTMVNIFSDSCGAAIIAKSEGETAVNA
ncbi:MAG: dicarboxylate/amino acid:cation symporter [Phycisphaerales bacterium]|nr:dicarboxylate/amino acid:cation symporter [Phycisphaerales bacterium]